MDDELHKEVAIEAINGTQVLQTEAKQHNANTSNRKKESMLPEQEQSINNGTKDANSQGIHQRDQHTTKQHTQVSQFTNAKVSTGEKAIWKAKEKTNANENTNNSTKEIRGK
ncbi:hypothetical protein RDI58_022223 [Solanum bulbocastanum]|uniref:Uncharacterized protein n=1 Tax=Solanum bulbocastanum TaxID=147425 RepID=A0AAN8Y5G0_SOLBU